jgi:peptidoglycan/LPS O-acetylase OafA/YrhL
MVSLEPAPSLEATRPLNVSTSLGWFERGRVPCLDGLRCISILLVLISHAAASSGFPSRELMLNSLQRPREFLGATGVDVFFVISGFLITLLMLRELRRTNTLSIKGFYTRRGLRILPVYIVFILTVVCLSLLGLVPMRLQDWAGLLTYTVNCVHSHPWEIGHIWSLSIEEQFYLLWPPLLLWGGIRKARLLLVCYLGIAPFFRLLSRVLLPQYEALAYTFTPARADSIAIGCLIALLLLEPSFRERLQLVNRRPSMVGLMAAAALCASGVASVLSPVYALLLGRSVNPLAIAVILLVCVTHSEGRVGRILNSRPFVAVGVLSYSIYIWQQLFLNPGSTAWLCRWPVNICAAVVVAVCSYHLIEAPFLRLKDRLSVTPLWSRVPAMTQTPSPSHYNGEPTFPTVA